MTTLDPAPVRVTREQYFALVDQGVLTDEDHVELLEGVIVAMAPEGPRHSGVVELVAETLRVALGARARVRTAHPFDASQWSVPEPDIAVVSGTPRDYLDGHPSSAHLVVEVAASSLPQDRLTKAPIYAAAGIPEYWIVNLRQEHLEVHRSPDRAARRYTVVEVARRGSRIALAGLPDVVVAVTDLLP
jgi:Uma2 family endonuclease